jgi:hypothetical protein
MKKPIGYWMVDSLRVGNKIKANDAVIPIVEKLLVTYDGSAQDPIEVTGIWGRGTATVAALSVVTNRFIIPTFLTNHVIASFMLSVAFGGWGMVDTDCNSHFKQK